MSASGCVLAKHPGAAGALHFGIFLANSPFMSRAVGRRWRDIPLESMQSHRVLPTGIKGPTMTGTSPNLFRACAVSVALPVMPGSVQLLWCDMLALPEGIGPYRAAAS